MQNAFLEFFRNVFSLTILCLILTCSLFASPEKVLHNFISYPLGANPQGPLIADASGNLYGVAQFGGNYPFGVVFRLSRKTRTALGLRRYSIVSKAVQRMESARKAASLWIMPEISMRPRFSAVPRVAALSFSSPQALHDKWTKRFFTTFWLAKMTAVGQSALWLSTQRKPLRKNRAWRQCRSWHSVQIDALIQRLVGECLVPVQRYERITRRRDSRQLRQSVWDRLRRCLSVSREPRSLGENILCSCDANGSLIMDTDGNLYGNSSFGAYGGVFELKHMKKGWNPITLYSFSGGSDGSQPWQGLTFDSTGNIYGVTQDGGKLGNCFDGFGCGTVFELIRSGSNHWTHKVLHTFMSDNDGEAPNTLLMDAAGTLYGTTMLGGDRYCTTDPDNFRLRNGVQFDSPC